MELSQTLSVVFEPTRGSGGKQGMHVFALVSHGACHHLVAIDGTTTLVPYHLGTVTSTRKKSGVSRWNLFYTWSPDEWLRWLIGCRHSSPCNGHLVCFYSYKFVIFCRYLQYIARKLCRWFVFCCGVLLVDFTHILQGYFTGTGAIMYLPQCQWSNP